MEQSSPATPPRPRITRAEWGILLLLAAIQFTNIVDFVIVMPLGPWFEAEYAIDAEQFGHIVAAYGFASFVGALLAAKFLDRFARKPALLVLYLGFTVSTLLCGMAQSYEALVGARVLAGLFGGVVGASVYSIVGDVFADYRRGTAMGVIMSSFAISTIFGLPIGLILAESFNSGAPFVALAGLCLLCWVGVFLVMPTLHAPGENRGKASLWRLLVEPNHRTAYAFTITLVLGSFTVVPYLALSMVANAGQSKEDMKYLYPIAGAFTLVSTNLVGRWSDRYGKKRLFRLMGFAAIPMAIVLTNLPPVPLWVAIAAGTAFMVATSGRMVPAQAMITGCAAPRVRGGFLSLNAAVQSVAMGVASLIGGALIGKGEGGRLPGYPIVGLIAAAAALLSLYLAGHLRSGEPPRVAEGLDAHPSPGPAVAGVSDTSSGP